MGNLAIKVENITKRYRLGQRSYRTLIEAMTAWSMAPLQAAADRLTGGGAARRQREAASTLWALDGVSFDVRQGEVVGLLGRNGAGKSTLLKILSRVTEPTSGDATIYGRVGSLLEVGTGFHPELTGRENVFLNGAILGMRRTEIRRKFDDIVDFADLARFIDTPVKRYSSGMYTRLAFAVAAHLDPEILMVDEVLAVGDVAFQKKCLGKVQDVARGGRTVLFVSHQMAAIESLCTRAILLDGGKVVMQGDTHEVIDHYMRHVLPVTSLVDSLALRTDRVGSGRLKLTSFHLEDTAGEPVVSFRSGMDTVMALGYQCAEDTASPRNVDVGIAVHDRYDQALFVLNRSFKAELFPAVPGQGMFRCEIPRLPLRPGRYRIQARITVNGDVADELRGGVGFIDVDPGDFYGTGSSGCDGPAPMMVDGQWTLSEVNETEPLGHPAPRSVRRNAAAASLGTIAGT